MDDLIRILEGVASDCDDWSAGPVCATIVRKASAALRASAEKEKEMVEALELIEVEARECPGACSDVEKLGEIARSILDKHKEPTK